jgi:hypothetical protein
MNDHLLYLLATARRDELLRRSVDERLTGPASAPRHAPRPWATVARRRAAFRFAIVGARRSWPTVGGRRG